jgi:hypothetical protein
VGLLEKGQKRPNASSYVVRRRSDDGFDDDGFDDDGFDDRRVRFRWRARDILEWVRILSCFG